MQSYAAAMTEAPPSDSPDHQRRLAPSERRTRALDAFIDLTLERGAHPRPEEVAERAEVSIASLYRYFADLDELRHDSTARLAERYPELFRISKIGIGSRQERIASFTAARLALHETLHPLQLLARATGQDDPLAQRLVDDVRSAMAEQIRRHFETELLALSKSHREDTVATIAALTSVESWEHFRRTHGRTPNQTRRAWRTAIDRVLPERPT